MNAITKLCKPPAAIDTGVFGEPKADAIGAQGAAQESPLPRSRVRIGRGRLPAAAHEPSGFGTGVLAALEDGGAGDQGRLVAFGSLYEAL